MGLLDGIFASADEMRLALSDDTNGAEILDQLRETEQQIAELHAKRVRLLAEFVRRRPGRAGRDFSEFAPDELSAALSWTRPYANSRLHESLVMTRHLPEVLDALATGQLDDHRAAALAEAASALPDEAAHQVTAYVLDRAAGRTVSELRRVIRRAVVKFDPQGAEERRRRSREDRRVDFTPQENGMASLWAFLPAHEAAIINARLDAFARQPAPDDDRTIDQRRADAFMDLMLNPAFGSIDTTINVTIPSTTLSGDAELPGDLPGYGAITGPHAREIAAASATLSRDTKWRRFITAPVTGTLVDHDSRTYRPSPRLAEFVRARDQYCVFPGCSWRARSCDIDHRTPYPAGATTAANLNCLCRHHHRLKHEGGWTLREQGGSYVWIDPGGIRYVKQPEPVTEPDPPPPELPPDDPPPF
jgi:uncharacterized protein DUF222